MDGVEIALDIRDLHYAYTTDWLFRRVPALHGITLSVRRGEFFGFLGHNGGGKTTTIKCILRLIQPRKGSIRIFGLDHRETRARRHIGYVPEQPYFYDHLTVRELMEMYATLAGVSGSARARHVDEALDLLGIAGRARSKMRSLSKGLTQRVAMAQAIVGKPRLLLLDEPFSGLDPVGRKEIRDLLLHLKRGGCTIFISSHIISDIEHLCDRVSILVNGELKGVFDISDVPEPSGGTFELTVRQGDTVQQDLRPLATSINEQGKLMTFTFSDRAVAEQALSRAMAGAAVVESFRYVQSNLEDVFVGLVKGNSGAR